MQYIIPVAFHPFFIPLLQFLKMILNLNYVFPNIGICTSFQLCLICKFKKTVIQIVNKKLSKVMAKTGPWQTLILWYDSIKAK